VIARLIFPCVVARAGVAVAVARTSESRIALPRGQVLVRARDAGAGPRTQKKEQWCAGVPWVDYAPVRPLPRAAPSGVPGACHASRAQTRGDSQRSLWQPACPPRGRLPAEAPARRAAKSIPGCGRRQVASGRCWLPTVVNYGQSGPEAGRLPAVPLAAGMPPIGGASQRRHRSTKLVKAKRASLKERDPW